MSETSLRYEMPSRVEAIPALLDRLEAYADASGLPPRVAARLALVIEELAANVAMHAPGATFVRVRADRTGDVLHLMLEDDGPPFDPLSAAPPDLVSGVGTRDVGGLGVHLVRTLTRDPTYERRDGRNRLTAVLDAG